MTLVPGFRKETRPCAWCGEDVWVDAILDHECTTPEEALLEQAQEDRALLEQFSGVHPMSRGPAMREPTWVREPTWNDLYGQQIETARKALENMGFMLDRGEIENVVRHMRAHAELAQEMSETLRAATREEYMRLAVNRRAATFRITDITDT